MSLDPILRAPFAVQLHFVTVVPAFVLGTWLIYFSDRGSAWHRGVGKVYLGLMSITAVAATFIPSFTQSASITVGPLRFGLLHLFVLLTAYSVWSALWSIRAGNLRAHEGAMRGLYRGGLVIAGLLAFMPGRIMHRMFFG